MTSRFYKDARMRVVYSSNSTTPGGRFRPAVITGKSESKRKNYILSVSTDRFLWTQRKTKTRELAIL